MPAHQQILRQLQALLTPGREPRKTVPVESDVWGALFPRGLRRGMLTEWLSAGSGSGVESLTLKLVSTLGRAILVVVDSHHDFYPPAAAALGIEPADTIIIRPRREADSLWAVEQSLRCRGVGAVLSRLNHVADRPFRRLQLAAERGGAIGVLIQPAGQRTSPSWAQARFLVRSLPSRSVGRRLQIESLHRDGGDVVELEMNDATGAVSLVSRLAPSTAVRRAAGA
ncbi:MAG: ImuA family protein [Planctomycetaceae bacterium]